MSFEPEKFFIGLLDFFSILLPGAVLTFLLMNPVSRMIWKTCEYQELTGAKGVAAFLVASYLSGHFVFLVGSWLDHLYDWARRHTLNSQIWMLSRRGELLPWPVRIAIWLIFKQERNLAVDCARNLKENQLGSLQAGSLNVGSVDIKDSVNTFQWCKAWLTEDHPKSLAVVQRFEADSKFFRCFVMVLLIVAVMWIAQHRWPLVAVALIVFLPLALWRYMEQRFKSTNQAYWSVITAFAAQSALHDADRSISEKAARLDGLTHAGGIVFRRSKAQRAPSRAAIQHRNSRIGRRGRDPFCASSSKKNEAFEYLLTEAKQDPKHWVLPKGHIEKGEQPRDTAVREVHEETGVWARIYREEPLGSVSFMENNAKIEIQFFLMEYAGRGIQMDAGRRHKWLSFEEAKNRLQKLGEARDLLDRAAETLQAGKQL